MFVCRSKVITAVLGCAVTMVLVQVSHAQSAAQGFFGLVGGMIAAAQAQVAQEAWANQPELRRYCFDRALSRHSLSIPLSCGGRHAERIRYWRVRAVRGLGFEDRLPVLSLR